MQKIKLLHTDSANDWLLKEDIQNYATKIA
jgi:hypothetical protein